MEEQELECFKAKFPSRKSQYNTPCGGDVTQRGATDIPLCVKHRRERDGETGIWFGPTIPLAKL